MRNKIVAANWKMNLLPNEGDGLMTDILEKDIQLSRNSKVIFCVPFTHLFNANAILQKNKSTNYILGAQNCYFEKSGAYTGEISIDMLKSLNVKAVIVGHSERRQYFHESNELLKKKVDALLQNGVTPLFCCGESLDIREANTQNTFVQQQLQESVFHLSAEQIVHVVIAYEPIWAIGTGKTASAAQAQEMHAFIRSLLATQYGEAVADEISILYGGSCNPANADELFALPDVDGGLIGGAALKSDQFEALIIARNSSL